MSNSLLPILQWSILGAGAGIVIIRVAFLMWRGLGAIFPIAVMFGCVGWMVHGWMGAAIAVAVCAAIGAMIGR